jgi:purine-cytosine permease-like protein
MGLLWITMVTAFPMVLMGFQWLKDGVTLSQVIACTVIGCLVLFAYAVPAAHLGAKSGLSYGALSRLIFGGWASRLASINILWIFTAWYSMYAFLLADTLKGIFHINLPIMAMAAGLAIAMAFNNFFGFSGVANFARFIAAPLIIAAVVYTFGKVLPTCPITALNAVSSVPFATALTSVAGFVIGFMVWGNEPDYWRHGKPETRLAAIPLAVTFLIGGILFPVAGWMVARMSGITEFGAATSFINSYSFGGIALLAPIVLAASYCAGNDSNLYGMINAVENLKKLPHHAVCATLAILCAAFAAYLSTAGLVKSLESITSLNCIFLPTVTVIMFCEFFLIRRILGIETDFTRVPAFSELPAIKWVPFSALMVGYIVGVATSGVIPGTEFMHVGLCSAQAWLAAAAVYIPARLIQHGREEKAEMKLLQQRAQIVPEPELEFANDG